MAAPTTSGPLLCQLHAKINWLNVFRTVHFRMFTQEHPAEILELERTRQLNSITIHTADFDDACSICLFLAGMIAREEFPSTARVDRMTFVTYPRDIFLNHNKAPTPVLWPRYEGPLNGISPGRDEGGEIMWSSGGIGIGLALSVNGKAADNGHAYPAVVQMRRIDADKADLDLARGWIKECQVNHDACRSEAITILDGLKVINLRTGSVECASQSCKYVALSYVWGQYYDSHDTGKKDSVPANVLANAPATIIDAAKVAQDLGYEYLWVDRYCIPQDNLTQKARQIQAMDLVYSQAQVTIIAAAGGDPQYGLSGISPRVRRPQLHTQVQGPGCQLDLIAFDEGVEAFQRSTWRTRGWTYQEGICSCRCLIFTDEEMLFQCGTTHLRETTLIADNSIDIFTMGAYPSLGATSGQEVIWRHIAAYSLRHLTYDSDALKAMLGIFRTHQQKSLPIYHVWGLPFWQAEHLIGIERSLCCSMLWTRASTALQRRTSHPSWSWSGWKGAVENDHIHEECEEHGTVFHLETLGGTRMSLGDIYREERESSQLEELGQSLHVESYVIELNLRCSDSHIPDDNWDSGTPTPCEVYVWSKAYYEASERKVLAFAAELDITRDEFIAVNPERMERRTFMAMMFNSADFLARMLYTVPRDSGVVEKMLLLERKGNFYERVGLVYIYPYFLHRITLPDTGYDEKRQENTGNAEAGNHITRDGDDRLANGPQEKDYEELRDWFRKTSTRRAFEIR